MNVGATMRLSIGADFGLNGLKEELGRLPEHLCSNLGCATLALGKSSLP